MKRRAFVAAWVGGGVLAAAEVTTGTKVKPFELRDLAGKAVDVKPGAAVTVVTFISTRCPVSNGYNDRMISLYEAYSKKGVQFFFVNANSTEPVAEVKEHIGQAGYPFPVFKDGTAAEALGAEFTPESFVLDKSGKLVYHGFIDDSKNTARVTNPALQNAIDATLAGKPVAEARTRAFGCTIKRARRS